MSDQNQVVAEVPLWMVVLALVLAGLSGEMWRADKAGLTGWDLLKRIALRAGASAFFGLGTFGLVLIGLKVHIVVAVAVGCIVATMGADVASALYERWVAKRMDVCDVPPPGGADEH
ncbi:phage holin family protein [Pseudomonas sp. BN515]|uniref:phage holin family protein n=1 Tax=Pseudomonas sp. BN515 TaxID=2567892 RepID=UPI0024587103|nr:phage holin family protein [Pseudomonas sp. BN515]MDH4873029.1 pyocin R2, holin [Pseudomonas sp. BN515]